MEAVMRNLTRMAMGATFVGFGFSQCTYIVQPGEAAIIYDKLWGVQEQVYYDGLHWKIPGLQMPQVYEIRLRPAVIETSTGTKDLQKVSIRLRVLFTPRHEHLPALYSTLGLDYNQRVLPSIGNEIMKAVVANFNAEELVTCRAAVSAEIKKRMTTRAFNDFDINLHDISLMDISFSNEFMQAVEQKQVAQQEAQRFQWVVLKNEQEKKAAITRAEGEAQAAKLISDAIHSNGDGLVQLRKIEAAKDIATTLAQNPNVQYVPHGGNVLLGLRNA
eukprot:TRINITY_DN2788_c0_g1_i1.p2 TRINITY_DN2788_c0_g1~~TRINITY_DN2788_c0_g1_i1.p2  ORF type:complete len:306 (+),score=125.58 TRINITY_DN2788_c0_g1_i1:97-918(+)